MKKIISAVLCAALVCTQTFAANAIDMRTGAGGAVMIEASTGRVLFSEHEHKKLPMASTTKIMTALLTLEQPDLDAPFVVDEKAIMVEGSSMGLQVGDTVTLRALATGMLLSSGNDAANAAAVRIAGDIPSFVVMMNEKAKALGMNNSSFETPSGLDGEQHYSTAYDMAILTAAALKNEDFADLAASKTKRVSFGNPPYQRTLSNHNRLLSLYDKAVGVKTGFTKKSGRCLVTAAAQEGLTLIMVTLNCGDDFNTHKRFYEEAFRKLEYFDASQLAKNLSVRVTGAEKAAVKVNFAALGAYLTNEEASRVRIEFLVPPFVYAPVMQGQQLGVAQLFVGDVMVSSGMVLAADRLDPRSEIEERSILEKLEDYFEAPQYFLSPDGEDPRGEKPPEQRRTVPPQRTTPILPALPAR